MEAAEDGPRPFTALLDTGLKRTSTGSKVFAALKVSTAACQIDKPRELCCVAQFFVVILGSVTGSVFSELHASTGQSSGKQGVLSCVFELANHGNRHWIA